MRVYKQVKPQVRYCGQLVPCHHRLEIIDPSLQIKPWIYWCRKCKKAFEESETVEKKP